jgi:hypothetical protein
MRWSRLLVLFGPALFGAAVPALAQTGADGYAGIKAGLHVESAEDDLQGTAFAAGAVVGVMLSEAWGLEGEFWYPAAIRTSPENGQHRDTLFSVDLRRVFGGERVRPYLLFGASLGRTEDQFVTCTAVRSSPVSPEPVTVLVPCADPDVAERRTERFASGSLFPLGGAGLEIAIGKSVRVMPELRAEVGITAFILRPGLSAVFAF